MSDQEWTIQKILAWMTTHFTSKNIQSPRLDAEILLAHVLKCKRLDLYLKFDQPLQETELKTLRDLIVRRAKREPVAYIIGQQEFYGRNFNVGVGVLIPRPETEHLVDEAVRWLKEHYEGPRQFESTPEAEVGREAATDAPAADSVNEFSTVTPAAEMAVAGAGGPRSNLAFSADAEKSMVRPVHVLDVGSGSGCIGITLAAEFKHLTVTAIDKSEAGVSFTRANAETLQVSDRVSVIHQAFEDFHSDIKFDMIVTNPPYVASDLKESLQPEVARFEPAEALYGGPSGHETFARWLPRLSLLLKPGGLLLCEIGFDQASVATQVTQEQGEFGPVEIIKDYSGHQRILKAVRHQL